VGSGGGGWGVLEVEVEGDQKQRRSKTRIIFFTFALKATLPPIRAQPGHGCLEVRHEASHKIRTGMCPLHFVCTVFLMLSAMSVFFEDFSPARSFYSRVTT
jgi:hypothetical protein